MRRTNWRRLLPAALVAVFATTLISTPAQAAGEQFNLTVSEGPAGVTGKFTQGDPCPTYDDVPGAWSVVEFTFTDSAGTVSDVRASVGANPDGTWQGANPFTIPYRSLGTTDSPPKFPSEAALGMGSFTARCVLHPGGNVVQEYAPQPFNVTGASNTFSVTPTTVLPSADVTISSVDPCPSDQVEVEIRDATHARITEPRVVPDANGAWSVTMPASQLQWDGSPDIPFEPGAGVVRAYCMVTEPDTSASVVFAYADQALTIGGAPPAADCKDVAFIAVTGSGEHFDGISNLKVSPTLKTVYQGFTQVLADGKKAKVRVINYPAHPVTTLTEEHDPAKYLAGKNTGTARLTTAVNEYRADCPGKPIVLAGYSQGALIVREFMLKYAAANSGEAKQAITGAIEIANPARLAESPVTDFGTADWNSYGLCKYLAGGGCFQDHPLVVKETPPVYRSRTFTVCNKYDVVCDTSTDAAMLWPLPPFIFPEAQLAHQGYTGDANVKLAGKRVARLVNNKF